MACIFCASEDGLTDEHIFPAFMGGELVVPAGSCAACNGTFGVAEGLIKKSTKGLLNLLAIKNRYGDVPSVRVKAEIRGMDMKGLNAFIDGHGEIKLCDIVIDSKAEDGRTLRQGFFMTEASAEKFATRGRAKGAEVIARRMPAEIVIEATSTLTMRFAFSIEARKVAAKIALTAIAHQYGVLFACRGQFDKLRQISAVQDAKDLPVWVFANALFMATVTRTAYQHSVMCYMSAGMHKGWALVTLFGGVSYIVEVTTEYDEPNSRQFSVFYDAASKTRVNPIILADEMAVIGHVLSPATSFEDRDALEEQWFLVLNAFCAEKGLEVERIGRGL